MPKKSSSFPTVPEVKLKSRRVVQQRNIIREVNRKPKPKSTIIFHHPEDFVKQHRAVARSKIYQRKSVKNFRALRKIEETTGSVVILTLYQRFSN